ncbi:MAG TPA: hypothetical protein DEQ03_02715, partial [Marinilabiliales bacterium]|nr:hypothetical protein [Marinilabiliales bacterium]
FLGACNEYYYIPDDMKFKYNEGDTVIFKSTKNDLDTFEVKWKSQGFDVHDKQYYYEMERIGVKYAGQDSVRKRFFINNDILLATNGFLVTWGDFQNGNKSFLHDSIKINGRKFISVYEIESDTSINTLDSIYKILFSRNYGVLKYCYKDGTEYEFYRDIVK